MFLLANSCAREGVAAGIEALREGRPLLDVLEIILRAAESDITERSVGLGGWPNLLGQVELDASLMEGTTRLCGSVAALQGFLHPVSVARQVMERLPHVFLVGEGAARFAREIGAEESDLLTPESEAEWRAWLGDLSPEDLERLPLAPLAWRSAERIAHKDTAVALVSDGGHLASGTTTCGWGFKYPGRLGDSAVVGAGHYADSASGAAACTHTGEMTIRDATARAAVLRLEGGMTPEQACRAAAADLQRLRTGFLAGVTIYAADRRGGHFALSLNGVRGEYFWWTPRMERAEAREAIVI